MSASIVGTPLAFSGTGPINVTLASAPADGDLVVVLYHTSLNGGAAVRTAVEPFQKAADLGIALAGALPLPNLGAAGCTYDSGQGLDLAVLADPNGQNMPWNAIVYVITGQAGEDFVTSFDPSPANDGTIHTAVPIGLASSGELDGRLAPVYPSAANAIILAWTGTQNAYGTPLLDGVSGYGTNPWITAPQSLFDLGGSPDQTVVMDAASQTLAEDEPWNSFPAIFVFDDPGPFQTGSGTVQPTTEFAYLVIAASDPAPYETSDSNTPPAAPQLFGGNVWQGTGDPSAAVDVIAGSYTPTPGNAVVLVLGIQNPSGDDYTLATENSIGSGGTQWTNLPIPYGDAQLALGALVWKVWQDGDAFGEPFTAGSGTPSADISWSLVLLEFSGTDAVAPIINALPDCVVMLSPASADDPQEYDFSGPILPRFAGPLYVGIVFGGEDPATGTGGLAINGTAWSELGDFSGATTSTENAPTSLMTISFATTADSDESLAATLAGTSNTMAGALALGFAVYAPVSLGAVPPPPITYELVITPDPATVPMGSIQQFIATKVGSDGTHTHPTVTWETNAGTIDDDGNFTPLTTAIGAGYVVEGTGAYVPYEVYATEVDS